MLKSYRRPNANKIFPYHSTLLTILFLVLMGIGLANLYSAGADYPYFYVQLKHSPIGFILFVFLGWFISIKWISTYAYLPYILVTIALLIVLVLGHKAGGAQRWLRIGPFGFQPSEFAKLALALAVAKFFYNNKGLSSYNLFQLSPILFAIALIFALIFKQPDFGTAGICLLIAMSQVLFIRIYLTLKHILSLLVCAGLSSVIGWQFLLKPYQKLRVLNLLDPNLDPSGSGYNSLQSLVAIGSGSQFGKGFLQGTQTQLQFLPARHTDFIFSVFAEEHGFWGGFVIFLLFASMTYIALEIARESRDSFSVLLAIGIAALIFIEFVINVAMVLGMFPVVGMPLPFFSFGGSSLITVCLGVGLLVCIDRDTVNNNNGGHSLLHVNKI